MKNRTLNFLCGLLLLVTLVGHAQWDANPIMPVTQPKGTNAYPLADSADGLELMAIGTNNGTAGKLWRVARTPVANFLSARPSLATMEQDDIAGMVTEISARGYKSNLVDVWPMQPRWGTNQTSFYGVPWTGNCSPWNFTNRQVLGDSNQIILPLRRPVSAFTLAIVIENTGTYAHGPSGSQLASYRTAFFQLFNTNNNSLVALHQWGPSQLGLVASQSGVFPVSYMTNENSWQSNEVLLARSAQSASSCFGENHFHHKRTTWIVSFNGTNKFSVWENGNPCAFPLNGGSSSVTFNYTCPVTITSQLNQITLGYSDFWRTNIGSGGYGYGGKIDSVMLFDCAAETNAIDATGYCSGSPLVNCAYAASRWLEPSTVEMIADGTSMMNNGTYNGPGTSGNMWSNCVFQAWFNRHPEWPGGQVYCQSGSALQFNTNCGGQLGISPFKLPMVGIYQLPAKVTRKIIFTDHPRNDNNLGVQPSLDLFTSYYLPLRSIGCEIWQGSLSIGNTNQTRSFPVMATNNPGMCFGMATNKVISKFVPLFKYISQGGISDVNDPNLAIVQLGTSAGAHYEGTNAQYFIEQYINLVEGGQFYPKTWPIYMANAATWSGYPPLNGYMMATTNSPYLYTNTVLTSVKFFFTAASHGGVGLNGSSYPMPQTGGEITLLPSDIITITNPATLSCGYRPLDPSNSFP